ncbi:MAG: cytidine deaminase [Ferruginibacter sp.]
MKKIEHGFTVDVYDSADALPNADADLLNAARAVTANAYAPYSNFLVGAVAQMQNGKRVSGTNQENASYPVGICAERVLLSVAATEHPGVAIKTIAISYNNKQGQSLQPISPCGMCRQSLCEYEQRTGQPIRLILSGQSGEVFILETATHLLPLSFGKSDLA